MKSILVAAVVVATALISQRSFADDAPAAAVPAGTGDAEHGAVIFKQCLTCHTNVQGQNKIGPSLWAVVGRHSASIPDYQYSTAMKGADKTWDEATLNV